jgi:hypothetical protein
MYYHLKGMGMVIGDTTFDEFLSAWMNIGEFNDILIHLIKVTK